jgi:hypothetical protein
LKIFATYSFVLIALSTSFFLIGVQEESKFVDVRYSCPRENGSPDIVYYFKLPDPAITTYPILILCEGSSSQDSLISVTWIFDYFHDQLAAMNMGLILVEQWGIDGSTIDDDVFWNHYSRSQRYFDHMCVINQLENNPPVGWNGELIFLGASEGGPLVSQLTTSYAKTRATVNWVGAADWSWEDELWSFFENYIKKNNIEVVGGPFQSREEYNLLVDFIKKNPSTIERFGGMTYFYLADAFLFPGIEYEKIKSPFLVIMGTEDPSIHSCDQFVEKALATGAPIEYVRVEGMDHYIRNRPDLIQYSFEWIKQQLAIAPNN